MYSKLSWGKNRKGFAVSWFLRYLEFKMLCGSLRLQVYRAGELFAERCMMYAHPPKDDSSSVHLAGWRGNAAKK